MDEHGVAAPARDRDAGAARGDERGGVRRPRRGRSCGATIEMIGGAREAELAFLSVARTFPELAGKPYVVVDVGGGSTEFIVDRRHARGRRAVSVPIGAVRLTERHLKSDPPTAAELARARGRHRRQLAALELPPGVPIDRHRRHRDDDGRGRARALALRSGSGDRLRLSPARSPSIRPDSRARPSPSARR